MLATSKDELEVIPLVKNKFKATAFKGQNPRWHATQRRG
jgi:hypothetical protein